MQSIYERLYKPDVLSCLADLSNDEVFTPPDVANKMLDLLPQELFKNKETKILDPACKSGVILREAAKRFIEGERDQFDSLQECIDWVFHNQIYGIAITELTSLLSRRSVYCSKYPNSPFSITKFEPDDVQGNILFHRVKHEWTGVGDDRRCKWCGASYKEFGELYRDGMESHAYEFVHTLEPEAIFDMKFDVICSNPPYQLNDGGNGVSASPLYHKFVEQAKKLNPRYLTMIIPSRYLSGGKGLDNFRKTMLRDRHLVKIVDFINAKDCFPQNSVSGGVNYFLWDRDHEDDCEYTNVRGEIRETQKRRLDEFPVFVRYNEAIDMIHSIMNRGFAPLSDMVSSRNPFGIPTSARGAQTGAPGMYRLTSSKGVGYVKPEEVTAGGHLVNKYKIMVSRITYEHAGEPDKNGMFRVLSRIEILGPQEVCTDSYLVIGPFDTKTEAENCAAYLKSKFARFLVSQTLSSINLSKEKFSLIPIRDFSHPVDIDGIYEEYGFSNENVDFINSLIHDFEEES